MATPGYSAKFGIGLTSTSGNPNYTYLDEECMVSFPNIEVSSLETTHLESEERWKTFRPGLKNGGNVTVEAWYSADNYEVLHEALGTVYPMVSESPTDENQTCEFQGFITKLDTSFEPDGIAKIKFEVKVTGPVDLGEIS